MKDTAVEVKDVSVRLGKGFWALRDVSVKLPARQIVGFIGPSGAGKTTLMRSIVGRQKVQKGEITVLGRAAGTPALRQQMSYMTQEVSVYLDLSVYENVHYFATMVGVKRPLLKAEVERVLSIVKLQSHARHLAGNLSGGEKQRLSLAIALIGKPQLLVLDEPTVGLDPVLREELWRLFRQLVSEGMTLVISSHVMDEAERCDGLLLIRGGRLLAQGSPAKLRQQSNVRTIEEAFLKLVGETHES